MNAWHFLPANGRLQFKPRRRVDVGEWLSVDPDKLVMCQYGLHASKRPIDALQYAPGALLCYVELGGKIIEGNDKVCAERRRVIAMADATTMLHEFACRCAEDALHLIPDAQRPIAQGAIDTKRAWLRKEATNAELDAAWDAAWDAARDAARAAARDAQNERLTSMARELLKLEAA